MPTVAARRRAHDRPYRCREGRAGNVAVAAPLPRAGVTRVPSTPMAPSHTVGMCGDHLRPSATIRPAREDVHALSGMPESATVEATFVFADIAGFTPLTEPDGSHEAAALVADSLPVPRFHRVRVRRV